MKYGTFIGVRWSDRTVTGANHSQMTLEEYMRGWKIDDADSVIGPFEDEVRAVAGDDQLEEHDVAELARELAKKKQAVLVSRLKSQQSVFGWRKHLNDL
jgi:fructose-1-phosphate kinase PfkB-like protein